MQEESDITGQRGLEHGTDRQTFEVFVPPKLREHWDTVLLNMVEEDFAAQLPSDRSMGARVHSQTAHAQSTLNRFFMAFIDHAFRDLDYVVTVRTGSAEGVGGKADTRGKRERRGGEN